MKSSLGPIDNHSRRKTYIDHNIAIIIDGTIAIPVVRGQKLIYWGPLKPLENILLRSPIAPWSFFASNLYHNSYWLRFIGQRRIEAAMKTSWGQLFQQY